MRFAFGIGAPTDRGFGLRTWLAFLLASSFATAIPGSACAEDVPWLWRPGHTSASTNGPGRGLAATPKTGLGLRWVSERDPAVWGRGERWRIPFSDGDSAVLRLSNVEVGAQGGIDVQGTWEGEPGSVARLRFRGRTAAGYWTRGDGTRWVLVPENGGDSRLRRVEPDSGGRCGNADLAETTSGPDLTGIVGEEDRRPARAVASASPAIESLDLLILYTAAAEEGAGGEAGIRVLAELSVAEANDVFERSAVRARLRLVGAVRVDYAESGDLGNDLNRLTRAGDGWLDEAHRLRDAHAADMICLVTEWEGSQQYAGMANQLRNIEASALERGFSVCLRPYLLGNYTLAHELGHVLGANHDRDTNSEGGVFRDAYGARFQAEGVLYRTVMAYRPGVQVPHFSNPDVSFRGVPTGVRGVTDNARALNAVAPSMARVREPVGRFGFTVSGVAVGEWERSVVLAVERRGPAGTGGTVRVRTVPGSASAGWDFEPRDEVLMVPGDAVGVEFVVPLRDSSVFEGERRFSVVLDDASEGWALGPVSVASVTIRDDEDDGGRWLDTSFRARPGADLGVRAIAIAPGDGLMVGGGFTAYDAEDRPRLALVRGDGSVDTEFRAKVKYAVHAVLPWGDGRWVVGGDFNTVNDRTVNHVAVLRADGQLAPGFEFEKGTDLPVRALARAPGDKILLGGTFTSVQGVPASRVARITTNGVVDRTFDGSAGPDGPVLALRVDAAGRTLVGGSFARVGGRVRGGVARLDAAGRLDSAFAAGAGANGAVASLAIDAEGRVLVAGDFDRFDGRPAGGIVRLTPAGAVDVAFRSAGGTGADGGIRAVLPRADGTIWIAGIFGRVDGVARSRVARLLGNGELDGAFDPGSGPNDGVTALAERGDGGLVLGGMFTEVMGIPRGGVAVLIPELGPTVRFDAVWAEAEGLGWHGTGWSRQRYAVESRGPWGGWRTVGEVSAADGRLRGRVPADSGSAGIYRLRRIWE